MADEMEVDTPAQNSKKGEGKENKQRFEVKKRYGHGVYPYPVHYLTTVEHDPEILLWITVQFAGIISWISVSIVKRIRSPPLVKNAMRRGEYATTHSTSIASRDGLRLVTYVRSITVNGNYRNTADERHSWVFYMIGVDVQYIFCPISVAQDFCMLDHLIDRCLFLHLTAMSDPDRHDFPRIFQTSRSGLEARISVAKSGAQSSPSLVQELSHELAGLSKSLSDANIELPTYDQRQYGLQIKALEKMIEELRTASKPKAKFAFKRTATVLQTSQRLPPPTEQVTNKTQTKELTSFINKTDHALLSSHSYRYISTTDLFARNQCSSDITISHLDHCIVNLTKSPESQSEEAIQFSAVHVEKITNSVLILPMINGSILLYDLTNCVVAVGCHQFRMHSSQKVHAYLSIPSSPVIEHCSEIQFTAYPDTLGDQHFRESKHLFVQDFSHIRLTPSPHWSILDNDSIIKFWPNEETQDKERIQEVLVILLPNA
ncbi:hypothetical protein AX15_000290 [Amanita polypyramis BW_CC]|nr:hypothetical protein AX15_000290 [Amanita polypyramis BW_CC]